MLNCGVELRSFLSSIIYFTNNFEHRNDNNGMIIIYKSKIFYNIEQTIEHAASYLHREIIVQIIIKCCSNVFMRDLESECLSKTAKDRRTAL